MPADTRSRRVVRPFGGPACVPEATSARRRPDLPERIAGSLAPGTPSGAWRGFERTASAAPRLMHRLMHRLITTLVLVMPACGEAVRSGPRLERRSRLRDATPLSLRPDFGEAADIYLAGDLPRAREAFRRLALRGSRQARPSVGRRRSRTQAARGAFSIHHGATNDEGDLGERAWAWYWAGRCELALGRLGSARSSFERALASSGSGPRQSRSLRLPRLRGLDIRAYALSGLADASLAGGRPAGAIEYLARIKAEGLAGKLAADELLFRWAAAFEALGRRVPAAKAFERLARLWPDSGLAAESRARAESARRAAASRDGDALRYTVVAGRFSARESADAVVESLRRRGFRVSVESVLANRRRSFLVSLGDFKTRPEAERARREAERRGFPAEVVP